MKDLWALQALTSRMGGHERGIIYEEIFGGEADRKRERE